MNALNPYAPPVYNGINDCSPPGFRDVDYTYVFLDSFASSFGADSVFLQTDKDVDFVMLAVQVPYASCGFAATFTDGQSYFLCDQLISGAAFQVDAGDPFPIAPGETVVPAGAQIRIDRALFGTNGTPGSIEWQFRGKKRIPIQ